MSRRPAQDPPHATRPDRARAFSLLELTISLAAGSVLLVALGSAVVISGGALPRSGESIRDRVDLAADADRIVAELAVARSVASHSPTAATFTIADRTGDGLDDTIEYAWAGPGAPVRRRLNAGSWIDMTPALGDFELTLSDSIVNEEVVSVVENSTGEVTLDSFTGWRGLTSSAQSRLLSSTQWVSQVFSLSPPRADITRLQITRVSFRLARSNDVGNLQLAIHQAVGPIAISAGNRVGSPSTVALRSLSTSMEWTDFLFSDVVLTPSGTVPITMVLSGTSGSLASVGYLTASGAPTNSYAFFWSDTGGTLWGPLVNASDNEATFFVTGRYWYNEQVRSIVSRRRLTTAGVRLVRGAVATQATATMLNRPLQP